MFFTCEYCGKEFHGDCYEQAQAHELHCPEREKHYEKVEKLINDANILWQKKQTLDEEVATVSNSALEAARDIGLDLDTDEKGFLYIKDRMEESQLTFDELLDFMEHCEDLLDEEEEEEEDFDRCEICSGTFCDCCDAFEDEEDEEENNEVEAFNFEFHWDPDAQAFVSGKVDKAKNINPSITLSSKSKNEDLLKHLNEYLDEIWKETLDR